MRSTLLTACCLIVATACSGAGRDSAGNGTDVAGPAASVTIRSSDGSTLGTLTLASADSGGVHLAGTLTGLTAGPHGIHIHAVGQCDQPGFTSAGGHFNPEGRQHGLRNPAGPHAGDAENITADSSGSAQVDVVYARASLDSGATTSIWDADGSAVVVHATADDQMSDPAGNAGARVGCGVVERS